jgi:hypothetical protein
VREPLHSGVSREARANALAAVSVPPGHNALPWRLTVYPTARTVRTSCGVLATAKA